MFLCRRFGDAKNGLCHGSQLQPTFGFYKAIWIAHFLRIIWNGQKNRRLKHQLLHVALDKATPHSSTTFFEIRVSQSTFVHSMLIETGGFWRCMQYNFTTFFAGSAICVCKLL